MLALLELNLGSGTDLEDSNAAGELSQALLQLLAVVIGIGAFDLGTDLLDAAVDLLLGTSTLNDGGLVLGDDNLACLAQVLELGGLEGEADLLGDNLAAGEDGHVLQGGLAAVAEARCLNRNGLKGAADLVHNEGG